MPATHTDCLYSVWVHLDGRYVEFAHSLDRARADERARAACAKHKDLCWEDVRIREGRDGGTVDFAGPRHRRRARGQGG